MTNQYTAFCIKEHGCLLLLLSLICAAAILVRTVLVKSNVFAEPQPGHWHQCWKGQFVSDPKPGFALHPKQGMICLAIWRGGM